MAYPRARYLLQTGVRYADLGRAEPFRTAGGVAVRPLAEHIDRLEFNSITGVAIAVAYWRRSSPGRKRGRPGGTTAPCHGRPYEGWKMSATRTVVFRRALIYRKVSATRTVAFTHALIYRQVSATRTTESRAFPDDGRHCRQKIPKLQR